MIDAEQLYQTLEQILAANEQPPPTLRMVRRQLNVSYPTLYKVHPAACYEIAARYKAYIQQRKETRLRRLQAEIKQIAFQLHTEGIAPTQKRIAPYLSHPGMLRDPRLRLFLKEICQKPEKFFF